MPILYSIQWCFGSACVASDHVLLNDDTAPDGFDGTIENSKKSIAGGFDEFAVVFRDAGLDEVTLDPLHAPVRSLFVDLHEAAVAGDIAGYNRGKPPGHGLPRGLPADLARLDIANFSHRSVRFLCAANRSESIRLIFL